MAEDRGPVAGVEGRVGKSSKSGISHGKGKGHIVYVMCVALPTHVGAWSMAVLLGQPFEIYNADALSHVSEITLKPANSR